MHADDQNTVAGHGFAGDDVEFVRTGAELHLGIAGEVGGPADEARKGVVGIGFDGQSGDDWSGGLHGGDLDTAVPGRRTPGATRAGRAKSAGPARGATGPTGSALGHDATCAHVSAHDCCSTRASIRPAHAGQAVTRRRPATQGRRRGQAKQ